MKKSVLGRPIGAAVLVLVAIVLGILCFVGGVLAERAVARDERYVSEVTNAVQTGLVGVQSLQLAKDDAERRLAVADTRAARETASGLLDEEHAGFPASVLYSPGVRVELATVEDLLRREWVPALSRALDSSSAPGGDLPTVTASVRALARRILNPAEGLVASLSDAGEGVARPLIALIGLFVSLLAVVSVAWLLAVLVRVRRGLLGAASASAGPATDEGIPESAGDDLATIAGRMHTLAFLQGLVAGLGPGFDKLIGEVDRLQADIERVSASARNQTTLVEEAARAHAGVTEAVRGIGAQTGPGSRAAREGSGAAELAEERLARAFQTARGVEDKAARIEEAVALIGDVADQTELVSLNAAIEAARAGEAGRGFTSVAQQLRKLADRSASAAAEMGELVESVLEGVRTVAIEARESMDAGGDLRRHLEAVSQGLESLLKLSGSASEAAAKEGASLESLAKLSADAGRELHDTHAAYDALRVQLNDLFRNVRRATAGRRGSDEGDEQRPLPAASESVLAGKVAGAG